MSDVRISGLSKVAVCDVVIRNKCDVTLTSDEVLMHWLGRVAVSRKYSYR